jgi:hypothetical protein
METHIETEYCIEPHGGDMIICDLYFTADWGRDYDTGNPTLGLSLTHAKHADDAMPVDMLARLLEPVTVADVEERIAERLLKECRE